jgi:hypothetical protein
MRTRWTLALCTLACRADDAEDGKYKACHSHANYRRGSIANHAATHFNESKAAWLSTNATWLNSVSAMSRMDGHPAANLFDHDQNTFWEIGTYSNQWAVADMHSQYDLHKIKLLKRSAGGVKVVKWMIAKTPTGPWEAVYTFEVPGHCLSYLTTFRPTKSRYWKMLIKSFHQDAKIKPNPPTLRGVEFFGMRATPTAKHVRPSSSKGAIQGTIKCPCSYLTNTDLRGNETDVQQLSNKEQCCASCARRPECNSWTFDNKEGVDTFGWCYLQRDTGKGRQQPSPHHDSGLVIWGAPCDQTIAPHTSAPALVQCTQFSEMGLRINGLTGNLLKVVLKLLALSLEVPRSAINFEKIAMGSNFISFTLRVRSHCLDKYNEAEKLVHFSPSAFQEELKLELVATNRHSSHLTVTPLTKVKTWRTNYTSSSTNSPHIRGGSSVRGAKHTALGAKHKAHEAPLLSAWGAPFLSTHHLGEKAWRGLRNWKIGEFVVCSPAASY